MWKLLEVRDLLAVYLYALAYDEDYSHPQGLADLRRWIRIGASDRLVCEAAAELRESGAAECGTDLDGNPQPYRIKLARWAIKHFDEASDVAPAVLQREIEQARPRDKAFYRQLCSGLFD